MSEEAKMKKMQYFLSLVLILFLSVTGVTYAYYTATDSNTTTITGNAATVNLTLNVEKKFPVAGNDNTGVIVPQLSTALSLALKSGCVDGNKNVVCQVYEIKIANIGGTATQVVDGSFSFYSDAAMTTDASVDMPNLKWKLISSVDTINPANSVLGNNADLNANFSKNVFADDITLSTGDTEVYYAIVWIDETAEEQPFDQGNTFYGLVEFNSANGTGVTASFAA